MIASQISRPAWLNQEETPDYLPGFDMASALERVDGNRRLFYSLLSEFGKEFSNYPQKIRSALEEDPNYDLDSARLMVHAVKGMAGNLSAQKMFAAARVLEKAIKEERQETWPELLEDFEQQLTLTLQTIASLPPEKKVSPEPIANDSVDPSKVQPLLIKLATLIDDRDANVFSCLDALKPLLNETTADKTLTELETFLDKIDFKGAQTALETICGTLEISIEQTI